MNLSELKINKLNIENQVSLFKSNTRFRSILDANETLTPKQFIEYVFIFSCLNFCFWSSSKKEWGVHGPNSEKYTRSKAMAKSIFRLYSKSHKSTSELLYSLESNDFISMLENGHNLKLLRERFDILKQSGEVLEKKFDGNFINLLEKAKWETTKIINIMSSEFPSFNDKAYYKRHWVRFNKKAQACISYLYFNPKYSYNIENIDRLTALADYRLPQILRHLNILEYSKSLSREIDNKVEIEYGSSQEIEIRVATIQAVEEIKKVVNKKFQTNVISIEIDNILWNLAQDKLDKMKPHHLTQTIFY